MNFLSTSGKYQAAARDSLRWGFIALAVALCLALLMPARYALVLPVEASVGLNSAPGEVFMPERTTTTLKGNVSAYNSLENQTDDTPFITAAGTRTREGIVANNCLPFGTHVEIAGKKYTVEDRMNKRYECDGSIMHFDIWFADYDEAMEFGRKELTVTVIE